MRPAGGARVGRWSHRIPIMALREDHSVDVSDGERNKKGPCRKWRVLSTDKTPYEIQIWSGMTMLRSFRTNEPTFSIPMAGLPAGLYFVRVVKDGLGPNPSTIFSAISPTP